MSKACIHSNPSSVRLLVELSRPWPWRPILGFGITNYYLYEIYVFQTDSDFPGKALLPVAQALLRYTVELSAFHIKTVWFLL